jgi:fucose permease
MTFDQTRRACYTGYVTQAIVNNLAPLLFIVFQTQYAVPYERLGRLVLLNFVTQLVTDLVAVTLVDRTGYRTPLVLAHGCCVVGLVLLAMLPSALASPYLGLSLAIVVYAIGGGLLEVVVSPVVDALPSPPAGKAAAMSLLHSFYCWGQVTVVLGTTLLLGQMGPPAWQALPLVWAVVPLANLAVFLRVPLPPTVPDTHRTGLGRLCTTPAFAATFVLMVCAGAAELTMAQWASLFAEQGVGLPKVWGDLAGPCLFAVLMGIGRYVYGLWGAQLRLIPALVGSGILATGCYLTAALASAPGISLVGCACCGLAVSLLWPGTFSLAATRFPFGGAAMFGLLAVGGDAGAAVGPWLAGVVAEATTGTQGTRSALAVLLPDAGSAGLRAGLLMGTLFPLGIVATAVMYGITTRHRVHDARVPNAP